MPKRVGRPVEARGLAVPVPDDAIERAAAGIRARGESAGGAGQLRTHHGGGAQFLVDGGAMVDIEGVEEFGGAAGDLEIVSRQR